MELNHENILSTSKLSTVIEQHHDNFTACCITWYP